MSKGSLPSRARAHSDGSSASNLSLNHDRGYSKASSDFTGWAARQYEHEIQELPLGTCLCTRVANRILFAKYYIVIYLFILGLTSFLLVYDLSQPDFFQIKEMPPWWIAFDATAITAFVLEISIRISARPGGYCRNWLNIIDLIVVMLCLVTLVLEGLNSARIVKFEGFSELVGSVLLGLRYIGQLARLLLVIRHQREHYLATKAMEYEKVDFSSYDDSPALHNRQGGTYPSRGQSSAARHSTYGATRTSNYWVSDDRSRRNSV